MNTIVGIDIGGSTTKISGFLGTELLKCIQVEASNPIASLFGAFGQFLTENELDLSDIAEIRLTGVGSSGVTKLIYGIPTFKVEEFVANGVGGRYFSKEEKSVVVSMGTGTAVVHARADGTINYLGGTGVGGGTLLGLSKLLVGATDVVHIAEFVGKGDLGNVDLRIKDMTASGTQPVINADMTAANFGNVSDVATKADIAKGIANLVYETVGMVSIFASRSVGVTDIVLTGNLTRLDSCRAKFDEFNGLGYGVRFVVPEFSEFSTAIGCAISAFG